MARLLIKRLALISALVLPLWSGMSVAEAAPSIMAYGKVGGVIPASKLDPNASVRLGGGVLFPIKKKHIAVIFDLGFSQTTAEETLSDPRVGQDNSDAQFSYALSQQDLNLFLGGQYFFRGADAKLVPYGALGLDLHFLKSNIEGTGGIEPLGENTETSTKVGFSLRGGAGYRLGPGMITGEISFAWAPIDHQITGESHLGRFAILVGYTAVISLP